jgi:hypothetical protein
VKYRIKPRIYLTLAVLLWVASTFVCDAIGHQSDVAGVWWCMCMTISLQCKSLAMAFAAAMELS